MNANNTEIVPQNQDNKGVKRKIFSRLFKWLIVSIPFIPVICLGTRVIRLVRQLLTLRGVIVMALVAVMWQLLPEIRVHLSKDDPFYFIPHQFTVFGKEIVYPQEYKVMVMLMVLMWLLPKILPESRWQLKKRLAILESRLANFEGCMSVNKYDMLFPHYRWRRLKNKIESLKIRIRFGPN